MKLNTPAVKSYFKGLIDQAIKLIINPVEFFRTMPKSGGLIEPMFFLVVTVLVDVVLVFVESFVSHGAGMYGLGMLGISLFIVPIIAVILSLFVAGIFYVVWSFMGSGESYEASFRCLAYMQSIVPVTILISIVPYLALLGIAWWFFLMVIATREAHNLPVKPALLVFGVIAVLASLVYYSSVTSGIRDKERLQEIARELQKVPGQRDSGEPRRR